MLLSNAPFDFSAGVVVWMHMNRLLALTVVVGVVTLGAPLVSHAQYYYSNQPSYQMQTSYQPSYQQMQMPQMYWCGMYYSYSPCTSNNYTYHNFSPYTYVNTSPYVNVNASSYASASSYAYPYSSYSYPYSNQYSNQYYNQMYWCGSYYSHSPCPNYQTYNYSYPQYQNQTTYYQPTSYYPYNNNYYSSGSNYCYGSYGYSCSYDPYQYWY